MAYDTHRASSPNAAKPADYREFGLNPSWGEHIVTGVVVAIAVMIVALIAVLMGMA